MDNKVKTLAWIIKNFSFLSSIRIFLFFIKKAAGVSNPDKKFFIKFRFNNKKVSFVIRENDDFLLLRDIFMKEEYNLSNDKKQWKTVFDCGAHIGFVSTFFHTLHPEAEIFCFEPGWNSFSLLKKNLALNKVKSKIFNSAISDKDGFSMFNSSDQYSASSKIDKDGGIKVITRSLDSLINELKIKEISLLKLDIEGQEINAFRGLKKNRKVLRRFVCENHYEMYDSKELFKAIKKSGLIVSSNTKDLKSPIVFAKMKGV